MNNYNFTQSLDGLNNIEADNINTSNLNVGSLIVNTAEITTLSDCNLVNCTAETPVNLTSVVNRSYVDNNFVYKTGTVFESITGSKTFSNSATFNVNATVNVALFCNTLNARNPSVNSPRTLFTNLTTASTITIGTINTPVTIDSTSVLVNGNITLTNNLICNSNATFNNICPISNTNATLTNHLTTLGFNNGTYVNFTTDQTITGIKRFGTIFTGDHSWRDVNSPFTNRFQSYVSGTSLEFVPQFSNNSYNFYCKDNVPTQTNPLSINYLNTTINNNLICNLQTTFNNFTPICSVAAPSANNHLVRKDYCDTNFMFKTNSVVESITGLKTFNSSTRFNSSILLYSGTNQSTIEQFVSDLYITNLFNSGSIYLRTVPLLGGTQNSLIINTLSCDILSPTLNLTSATGTISILTPNSISGIINLFTSTNNTLNIGTLSSTMNVSPPTTFSSDITTPNIFCNTALYLNDTTYSSILVQNTDVLNFDANFNNNKFQFKVSSNAVLLLDATNTTIYNNLNSLSQATFSNFTPICNVASPTANNHLTRKDYVDNNFVDKTTTQTIAGIKTFNGNAIYNGTALYCNCPGEFANLVHLRNFTRVYDIASPFTSYTQLYMNNGMNFFIYPLAASSSIQLYCRNSANNEVQAFVSAAIANTSYVPFIASSTSTFSGQATFNNFTPICSVATPTANNHLTRKDYVDNAVSGSSILSLNNTFTGFNTFSNVNGISIRGTLLLKDSTNVQESSIDLASGLLGIACAVNSGKILLQTKDAAGNSYTRLYADATEIKITSPLTLFLDYTYYNPVNFTSTRLGYSTSNTGSTNTLTNNTANNSGQIYINAGSWTISYTGTITIITGALTTLTSLEIYVADDLTNDLNIIGVNVINYYQLSSVPIGKKMRISGSGNYISYINTSTELNLRLLPLFTAGAGGLNFQGKISATRCA